MLKLQQIVDLCSKLTCQDTGIMQTYGSDRHQAKCLELNNPYKHLNT